MDPDPTLNRKNRTQPIKIIPNLTTTVCPRSLDLYQHKGWRGSLHLPDMSQRLALLPGVLPSRESSQVYSGVYIMQDTIVGGWWEWPTREKLKGGKNKEEMHQKTR